MVRRLKQILVILFCLFLIASVFTVTFTAEETKVTIEPIETRGRGKQTIFVDTKAIDERTDLTDQQKKDLKDSIKKHLQDNLESAVGKGNVEVTDDASKKAGASRTVDIKNTLGDGAWGSWYHGSKSVNVYLKEFMDDPNVVDNFKTDGKWDLKKLGNALGHTCGHEIGHSFSVGHNNNSADKANKMTKGGNYGADKKATGDWQYDEHTKKVIKENWDKGPCKSAIHYDDKALTMHYGGEPTLPNKPEETGVIDTVFNFFGDLAKDFYFGIFGDDTDDGKEDGDPDRDFIYKSSMDGEGSDATMISFFQGAHDNTQFVLKGKEGTENAGELFPISVQPVNDAPTLSLDNFGPGPDSMEVAKSIDMQWDTNADSFFDVFVELDVGGYGENTNQNSGFTYDYVPRTLKLSDAIDQDVVKTDITGRGVASGYIADMVVTSDTNAPVDVIIGDPNMHGKILVNENEDEQDEVITGIPGEKAGPTSYTPTDKISLPTKGSDKILPVNGYCVNIDKKNPSNGTKFNLSDKSTKTDVSYLDPIMNTIENYEFPDTFNDSDKNKVTQIAIWAGNPENYDKTANDFSKRGYTITKDYLPVVNDILNKSGINTSQIASLTGETKDDSDKKDDEKEPTKEEDVCLAPGFDAFLILVSLLVAIAIIVGRRTNSKRRK